MKCQDCGEDVRVPAGATGVRCRNCVKRVIPPELVGDSAPGSGYYCDLHKYNPKPNSGMAFCPQCEGLPADLLDLDEIVNEPARDLWLPNLGRDQPGAEGEPR